MIKLEKKGKTNRYVYDISLDGTVVNALGLNVISNTDGFNFKLPSEDKYRYTKEHPYISEGLSRETKKGQEYVGFKADVAEFNDLFMSDKHYSPNAVNKMGLGIDEVVDATVNFSRKNYADYFPENPYPEDVKLVGNTIKSKKMPDYISKFLNIGIRQILRGDGQGFLKEYYDYIDKIYNYKIPLRDIATKGKFKKSLNEYIKDVKTLTKAGRPKSRQAWYELAIKDKITVNMGETLYYINTGTQKSHSDIKKVTNYFMKDGMFEEEKCIDKDIAKQWKENKDKYLNKDEMISALFPKARKKEEIVFNCRVVPRYIIDKEEDTFCSDMDEYIEYNVPKYIDMFNKRIAPLMVCFNKDIRGQILIDNPNNRPYFTEEQCKLVSGQPNKASDQDTYEQLMTMEDKEKKFWVENNLIPPFFEECNMGKWEEVAEEFKQKMMEEEANGVAAEKARFQEILNSLTDDELDSFVMDNEIPSSVQKLGKIDEETGDIISIKLGKKIGNIVEIYEESINRYGDVDSENEE